MREVAFPMLATVCGAIALSALAVGCGGSEEPTPAPTTEAANLPTSPAGERAVVAVVDGHPVYDDCVAIQVAADLTGETAASASAGERRRTALAQCIDFELLAREAERRGLAADPEVRRAREVESVRRLIDLGFRARYPDPETVTATDRELLEQIYERFKLRYVRPELRETSFLRAVAPADEVPPGSPTDRAARAAMEAIYAALAERRGLTRERFHALAAEVVAESGIEHRIEADEVQPIHRDSSIVKPYLEATFAIPEQGMISPPVRTEWGWDIILLRRVYEPRDMSLEEAAPELFKIARRRLYQDWAAALRARAAERGPIEIDPQTLSALQQAEEAQRFGATP